MRVVASVGALILSVSSIAACSATGGGSESSSEGALSQAECDRTATDARTKHVDACKQAHEEDTAKAKACYASADQAYTDFHNRLDAARDAANVVSQAQKDACKSVVESLACTELLQDNDAAKAALQSKDENVAAQAKRACELGRKARFDTCVRQSATFTSHSDAEKKYTQLDEQSDDAWRAWAWAYMKCWWQNDADKDFEACTGAQADRVYQREFSKCRKECPGEVGDVCVPTSRATKGTACGQIKRGFATRTCECVATDACDDFDRAIGHAGDKCNMGGGKAGARVVKLGVDPSSGAPIVVDACLAPEQAVAK